jgi:hypothetical protein
VQGSSKSDADFSLANEEFPLFENQSNYVFPNLKLLLEKIYSKLQISFL